MYLSESKKLAIVNDDISETPTHLETTEFLKNKNITVTMTISCKLCTRVKINKFAKNVALHENGIIRNELDCFYNCVNIDMRPHNLLILSDKNYVRIKIFENGRVHVICKDRDDFYGAVTKLIEILKCGKNVIDDDGKNIYINFIDEPDKIRISDVKIAFILSKFCVNYKINKKKLAAILITAYEQKNNDNKINRVEYNSSIVCITIKYIHDDNNKLCICIHKTGIVTIAGAKDFRVITTTYHFIYKILNESLILIVPV